MKKKEIKKTTKIEITGTVVSNKMTGTVKVRVADVHRAAVYGKVLRRSKVYLAHTDEDLNVEDVVTIRECKPYSKNVNWVVVSKQ